MHTLKIKILAPLLIFRHFETIIPLVSVTPHVVGNFYPLRISSPHRGEISPRGCKINSYFWSNYYPSINYPSKTGIFTPKMG